MKPDEAKLVEACIKHNQQACKQLYDRFAAKMYGVCLRYTRTNSAAEDVLHDGFVKVFASLHRLRDTDMLESFIRRIMIFTAINAYNREDPLAQPDTGDDSADPAANDELSIYDSIDIDFVMSVVRQLPPRYQVVFNLCVVEDYSYEEVSSMLGIEQSTVRSNLLRAKRILASKLAPYVER